MTGLARELANISEELEAVKAEMDQRGTSMTDAGPLVKIKQALTRLKAECTQMEIRIGVVRIDVHRTMPTGATEKVSEVKLNSNILNTEVSLYGGSVVLQLYSM